MKMVAEKLLDSLHSSRRLLLHTHVFLETQPTTTTTTTSHQENSSSSSSFRRGFDANLIMILSVLLCALICSLCVNSLIRCVFKCSTLLNRQPNYYLTTIRPGFNTAAGLDKRALSSFPVVKYSKDLVKIQGLDTECVICLSDFKQTEKLRILPVCNHGFHVKCIDRWLKSNSSCPTCRQSLVDTFHKIIGCHSHHHQSSAGPETVTGEMIPITIAPLQREDLVRNFRG